MPKTSRLEYINLNENRAGFEIAALESTQGYLGINKVKKTYEVSIIIGNSDKMKKVVDIVLEDYNLKSEYDHMSKAKLIVKL